MYINTQIGEWSVTLFRCLMPQEDAIKGARLYFSGTSEKPIHALTSSCHNRDVPRPQFEVKHVAACQWSRNILNLWRSKQNRCTCISCGNCNKYMIICYNDTAFDGCPAFWTMSKPWIIHCKFMNYSLIK